MVLNLCQSRKASGQSQPGTMLPRPAVAGATALLALLVATASSAHAAVSLVTFAPPALSQDPSIYVAVPGPQTINTTPATFTGGVVLGLATFFPAISFATTTTAPWYLGSPQYQSSVPAPPSHHNPETAHW